MTSHTGADLFTDRQRMRLTTLFGYGVDHDDHVEVEATCAVYERKIAAYRHRERCADKTAMNDLIDSLSEDIPAILREVRRLGVDTEPARSGRAGLLRPTRHQ